jgi:hypothetical protein
MSDDANADDSEPVSSHEQIELELPLAQLRLIGHELVRETNGIVVMRVPLKYIENIQVSAQTSWMAAVFLTFGIGMGLIGFFLCPWQWLSVILYILGIISFSLGLIGIRDIGLVLLVSGESVWIPCSDDPSIVAGFVASIRVRIEELKDN